MTARPDAVVIESARQWLRPFSHGDAGFVQALVNDADWLRFIGDRNIYSNEAAVAYVDRLEAHRARHGFGLLAVIDRDTGEPIGMCGLLQRDTLADVDLGFAYLAAHRGRGLAREAAAATLAHARDVLRLPRVVAISSLDHAASHRLLTGVGMRREADITFGDRAERLAYHVIEFRQGASRREPEDGRPDRDPKPVSSDVPHGRSSGTVVAVCRSASHTFSKPPHDHIRLLVGLGVEGDAHMGATVKHRSRVAQDPTQPNLRQVHLIAVERFEELRAEGFDLAPGDVGENITTRGLDLPALPVGTRLRLGREAVVEVTGLRNPCVQLDAFRAGLMAACLGQGADGALVRKAGIMGIVVGAGDVRPGDVIAVDLPPEPHRRLDRV